MLSNQRHNKKSKKKKKKTHTHTYKTKKRRKKIAVFYKKDSKNGL